MGEKKKKKIRTKRSWIVDIPISVCIFFIVVGILLGTVFTLDAWYFNKPINKDEAVSTSGIFQYYLSHTRKGSLSYVSIHFTDREALDIDRECFDVDVETRLENLEKGDKVEMLLHPISHTIWEMKSGDVTIVSFDESKEGMLLESILWSVTLIPVCYCLVIIDAISLCLQLIQNGKRKAKRVER